jgi:predicted ATPase/DNA-binding winged helix-turn-helix (wHTH) protein
MVAAMDGSVAEVKASTSQLIYASGQVEIDLGRRELRVGGIPVPIGGRAFEIIEILAREAGELVTTDQLMERVWPGATVEENTLQVHISAVRKALGPDRGRLKNLKGRGYRLLGTWNVSAGTTPTGEIDAGPAAQPSATAVSNNLPAAGTELIGRACAMQELQDLLSAYRVITLTGPGGIGKSKLALETARRVLAQDHGDVWLVELASLSDPGLMPSAVASALGICFGFVDVSVENVACAIGLKKILLLLDNCEHIIDAAAAFAETIIHRCPNATILATSREVLRIDGEYVYRVPPLDVPDRQDTPDNILKRSAVQLFVARTTAMNSAFVPDETNLPEVAAICRRLDGIPLAIEFAAARAALLGVSQVASHLDNRFSLLTAGRRTTLARHQTLRAALDWSYDLLPASEQCLLRHLWVFPAGFTLDAATAVMRDTGCQTTAIDDIANLVSKSLVTCDGSASGGGRWRLLETIRAYAFEKLRENGETERALRRHAEYFHDLLTPPGLVSTWEPACEAVIRYNREIDNIRAALDWCFSPVGDVSIGAAMTAAFLPVLLHFGLFAESRRRAETALADLGHDAHGDAQPRMLLHIGRGIALNHTGAPRDEALAELTKGLRIAEALGDEVSQMYALWGLWATHGYRGTYRAAEPLAEKFCRLAEASGDPVRGYLADRLMGTTMVYRGNLPKARAHFDRVPDQYQRSLERPRMAWLGYNFSDFAQATLARVLVLQGFLDQARHVAQTGVDRMQRAGQKIALCYTLIEAACPIEIVFNDMDAAAKYVTLLVDTASELDLTYWKSLARCVEGVLLIRQGNYEAGVYALRASLSACDEAGGTSRYSAFLGTLSEGLAALGRSDEARLTLDQALTRADRDGEEWCIPNLLCTKGKLALRESGPSSVRAATAERYFRDAIALAQRQGALFWELRATLSLARLHVAQNQPNPRQMLASVYERFTEGFDTADLRSARAMLEALPSG